MQIKEQHRIEESKFARINEFVRLLIETLTVGNQLTKKELNLLQACMTYNESKENFENLLKNFKQSNC